MTLLEKVIEALRRAAAINRTVQTTPAAILWTDKDRQWESAMPVLRATLPELFTLGGYAPEHRTGLAIWLKCALARTLPEFAFDPNAIPVLYLPGVSRTDLRAIESCPRDLQPLAELQYRGVLWSQTNGKDWTVNAFLTAKQGGLALNVAQDQATQQALRRAFAAGELLTRPLADFQDRRIDAAWLDHLLAPNPTRDILAWLDQPTAMQTAWAGARWDVFVSRCGKEFGFHPRQDGELAAAENLAVKKGAWAAVWELYEDAWNRFPGVAALLERVAPPPPTGLFDDRSGYPKVNLDQENQLRARLLDIGQLAPDAARNAILETDRQHGSRRATLWARMDRAPLARALGHLAIIAECSRHLPTGASPAEIATRYEDGLWRIDAEALDAWAAVRTPADLEAVNAALQAIYVPWLEESATHFQQVVRTAGGLNGPLPRTPNPASPGSCWMFVDGLRYDVAQRLGARLADLGSVTLSATWAAIPSVTASGKPWVSPVADQIAGQPGHPDFEPFVAKSGKPLNSHHFRKLLEAAGWQVLAPLDTGDPRGRAWVECGDSDHDGHQHGLRLARDLDYSLTNIVERLRELMEAGWTRFRIVTDHGWLLVPGGLPKAELASFAAETRWGRCAVLKETMAGTPLTLGWDWCPEVQIAMAPGIASFIAGREYAHGGLSLQECRIPVITLEQKAGTAPVQVEIRQITWRGLRCQIDIEPPLSGLRADLRTKPALAESSVAASPKVLDGGKASLVVPEDALEGSAAIVVILNEQGDVIQKAATTIGEP